MRILNCIVIALFFFTWVLILGAESPASSWIERHSNIRHRKQVVNKNLKWLFKYDYDEKDSLWCCPILLMPLVPAIPNFYSFCNREGLAIPSGYIIPSAAEEETTKLIKMLPIPPNFAESYRFESDILRDRFALAQKLLLTTWMNDEDEDEYSKCIYLFKKIADDADKNPVLRAYSYMYLGFIYGKLPFPVLCTGLSNVPSELTNYEMAKEYYDKVIKEFSDMRVTCFTARLYEIALLEKQGKDIRTENEQLKKDYSDFANSWCFRFAKDGTRKYSHIWADDWQDGKNINPDKNSGGHLLSKEHSDAMDYAEPLYDKNDLEEILHSNERILEEFRKDSAKYSGDTYSACIEQLEYLTGLTFTHKTYIGLELYKYQLHQYQEYASANKDYFFWSNRNQHFVIDEEAKKKGAPTTKLKGIIHRSHNFGCQIPKDD